VSLWRIIAHSIFGVFLPALALGFEIVTGWSDEIYVNPIPTVMHAILVGMVPAIIAVNLYRCVLRKSIRPWDLHLNSLCIALSIVYSVIYLPIAPFGVIGVVAYGIGFLPLAPLIALLSAYRLRKALKRRLNAETTLGWRHFFVGFAAGLALLTVASIPRFVTDYGIAQYTRNEGEARSAAIQLLRSFGSERALLKACYQRARPVFFWGGGSGLETAEARKLFYRVTGESFNDHRREPAGFLSMRGRSSFDRDLGGEHVGQRVEQIHLQESRLDGILEPQAGTGYVEWTMVFRNDDERREHEARMLLSMPIGGVASRVTLWVNGEPREAAFGTKAKVRAAYESVAVRQRRDPVLVNWAGPDLLLVQCFPILPNGGEMKIRIGMSFPLEVDARASLNYRYPAIVSENFSMADNLRHSVWYETKIDGEIHSLPPADLSTEVLYADKPMLRHNQEVLLAELKSAHPTRGSPLRLAPALPSRVEAAAPQAVVIDGSRSMRPQVERISKWLTQQQEHFDLYLASDEVQHFRGNGPACADWLRSQKLSGGQDNVPALVEALRTLLPAATRDNPQTLYWFSGSQPIQLSGTERIWQLFERRELAIDIVACLTTREYNALYELAPLSYSECLYLDEQGVLSPATITFEEVGALREAPAGSSHAHRIWLADQIRALARETYQRQAGLGPAKFQSAIAAIAHRAAEAYLVTQLSGAVVLETDQQYRDNDLEAGDPNHVPTVPEYKHFALILGLGVLTWMIGGRSKWRCHR
jgi:hypothetical protein